MSTQELHERLLYRVVREKVENAINPLLKGSGELAKDFGQNTAKVRLILLDMIGSAMREIYIKQKTRLEVEGARQAAGLQEPD